MPSVRARRFHKFASQYKWDEKQYKATSHKMLRELEVILDEGANSLSKYIDLDELKMYKILLRSHGITDDSLE